MVIRQAHPDDAEDIASIYEHYVRFTTISFEFVPPTAREIAERMSSRAEAGLPWLVARSGGNLVGYAYASKRGSREGFNPTAESTIYLHKDGRSVLAEEDRDIRVGKTLYRALLKLLQAQQIANVMGEIVLPNERSVELHRALGFQECGIETDCGRKKPEGWPDWVWMDLLKVYLHNLPGMNLDSGTPFSPLRGHPTVGDFIRIEDVDPVLVASILSG
jgi:phosphinothricin acetyltransferase